MAEEAPITTTATVNDVAIADKAETTVSEKSPQTETEPEQKKNIEEAEKQSGGDQSDEKVPESGSFKEESTKVSDLVENEKKALQELKHLIQESLKNHEFSAPKKEEKPEQDVEEQKEKLVEEERVSSEPVAADVAPQKEKLVEEERVSPEPVAADVAPQKEKLRVSEPVSSDVAPQKEKLVEEERVPPEPVAADVEPQKEKLVEEERVPEPVAADVAPPKEKLVEEERVSSEPVAADVAPQEEPEQPTKKEETEDGEKTVEAIEETVVAVQSQQGSTKSEPEETKKDEASPPPPSKPEEVSIWGVPLLSDDRTDVILLKFLRARDFKVKEAFTMIKNTIRWRKEFGIDELMEQDLGGGDLEKAVYMYGSDKEGHPVCYNIYGEFQNKELYKKTFSDEEKRQKFLRWRIQFLEKSIRKLDFNPGGVCTIVQVNDIKNSPGPGKWELRQATKQALQLLQDNYPEFVAKQVFINVSWWYLAVNRMISPFLTQRTKSKFVFAGPSKSAETLLRYIAPEQLPVKYGGLRKDGEFGNTDAVTEITVRPASKHTVEFPVTENCLLSWELRVIGWDVSYGAEFVPSSEGSYTVIIQKARKIASSEEPVISNSYKVGEPGKVVLTIDNSSSKKKKLLYRLKTKPSSTD